MRRVVVVAGLLLLPAAANAQVICVNCYDQPSGLLADALTAANWVRQIAQMRAHYTQLITTANSLKHRSPQTMQTAIGLLNNGSRLPGSAAGEMPGLNYGSNLSGAGGTAYQRNHVYTSPDDDWSAREIERRQIATANLQGEAQMTIERAEQRLAALNELQASLPEQDDVTAVAAMDARIQSEHAYLANESNRLSMLATLQQSQQAVDMQRAEQEGRRQAEEWRDAVSAQAWGGR